ncbi:MAG TPA: hypothetical protein VFO46_02275 [Candidatus Sulfotelmatobacter sp.]|nr:hypothetical protein [Candidatus Sulfotelmatobacter sp.]
MHTAERLRLRYYVMTDLTLSADARILYFLIDDVAGSSGEMFWHWTKLSAVIGVARRQFFYLIDELVKAGVIWRRREGRRVFWVLSVHKCAPNVPVECTSVHRTVHNRAPKRRRISITEPAFITGKKPPQSETIETGAVRIA